MNLQLGEDGDEGEEGRKLWIVDHDTTLSKWLWGETPASRAQGDVSQMLRSSDNLDKEDTNAVDW